MTVTRIRSNPKVKAGRLFVTNENHLKSSITFRHNTIAFKVLTLCYATVMRYIELRRTSYELCFFLFYVFRSFPFLQYLTIRVLLVIRRFRDCCSETRIKQRVKREGQCPFGSVSAEYVIVHFDVPI